jgi:ADP-ribosylglycohydrolase
MQQLPGGRDVLAVQGRRAGAPSLMGLISLAFVGLLHPGDPDVAYLRAMQLDFIDVGYACDAAAMLAAMVSAAVGGVSSGRELVRIGLETNPLQFGERVMVKHVRELIEATEEAANDREVTDSLATLVANRHPFDPVDVLGVPMAAIHYCDGDARRSLVMAINDRRIDAEGRLVELRDVDCTGSVTGAIVGAMHGIGPFPADWVADVLTANREVYGIDLQRNACEFCRVAGFRSD